MYKYHPVRLSRVWLDGFFYRRGFHLWHKAYMTFPQTSNQIYRIANRHGLYNFELAKDKRNVLIITPSGITTVHGHYRTHNKDFWLNVIRKAIHNNHVTPNVT